MKPIAPTYSAPSVKPNSLRVILGNSHQLIPIGEAKPDPVTDGKV